MQGQIELIVFSIILSELQFCWLNVGFSSEKARLVGEKSLPITGPLGEYFI
jgi:hypothetical protein